jgi:hypothetical protein
MENHDHNGHGESHDDHATEGNRQYYPKGWWMPLVGLLVVALGFTVIGYFVLGVSGTDKWGQRQEIVEGEHGTSHSDGNPKHDAPHEKGAKDDGTHTPAPAATTDTTKADTTKKSTEPAHEDHNADEHHH